MITDLEATLGKDATAADRVKRQRDARLSEGWELVSVWVPTRQDADELRQVAAERRSLAERLDGLSQKVDSVDKATEVRIGNAIAEQGSAAYNTPSGPVLDLLTQLASEDNLEGFSHAVVLFCRAKPMNADFVRASVPAKITNFLIRNRSVNAQLLLKWTDRNPDWKEQLQQAVRNPEQFPHIVNEMAEAINGSNTI